MRLVCLTLLLAVFYVAEGSDDYVNFIGEDREFVCDGSNGRWMLHNNTEIFESSAKYTLVKDENESKLVIKNINLKDSGDYRCLSSKAEKVFNLKLYFPQTITQSAKTEIVNKHGEVTFRCRSTGAPSAVFNWWFGDSELYESDNIKISSGTLTLKNIQPEQAGEYTCIADQLLQTNRNIQQRSFELIVVDPNSNYQKPADVVVKENGNLNLTCYSSTVANITVNWSFNGHLIVDEKGNKVTSNELSFTKVQREQAGLYTCRILGHSQKRDVQLTVEHAPVFRTASPVTVNGQIGTRATLTCAVDALPVPSFRWYQNGYEVFENIETFTSLSRLRVELKSQDSFKDYTCVVTNDDGENRLEFKLVEADDNASTMKKISMIAFILSAFALIA